MQLNSVVFPAPECTYSIKDFPGEMIYIPRNYTKKNFGCKMKKTKSEGQGQFQTKQDFKMSNYFDEQISDQKTSTLKSVKSSGDGLESQKWSENAIESSDFVPCLFLPYYSHKDQLQNQNKSLVESEIHQLNLKWEQNKKVDFDKIDHQMHNKNMSTWLQDVINHLQKRKHSKIMIFFHGNAEDIGLARTTLLQLKKALRISILAVEYSGYGLFVGEKSADKVLTDCLSIYDYVNVELSVAEEDIILFGRSLGSSPSCYIAKERPNVGSIILMSPFKSLREVAKDRVGKLLSYLLAERYRNVDLIAHSKCPVLIIHGMCDSIIDVSHSYTLKASCGSQICKLVTPYDMDHNQFQLHEDIITPIKLFFRENGIRLHKISEKTEQFKVDIGLYYVPKAIFDYDAKLKQQKQKLIMHQSLTKSDYKKCSKSMHNQTQVTNSQQVTLNCNLEENITQPVVQNKNNMFKSFKSNSIHNMQQISKLPIAQANNIAQLQSWKFQQKSKSGRTSRNNEFGQIGKNYYNDQYGGIFQEDKQEYNNGIQNVKQMNNYIKNRETNETTYDANVRSVKKFNLPEENKENISSIANQNQQCGDDEFNLESFDNFLKNSEYKQSLKTYKFNHSNINALNSPNSRITDNENKQKLGKIKAIKMQNEPQKQIWKTQMTQINNTKSQDKITIPDITIHRYIDYTDQQKTEEIISARKQQNQQTPNKIIFQNSRSESFNLSPQSVKQSLPPETSNEGGTTIKNISQQNSNVRSMASKMSQKNLQRKVHKRQRKKEKFNQYNYQNMLLYSQNNEQNQSYIDLLNEKETEHKNQSQNNESGLCKPEHQTFVDPAEFISNPEIVQQDVEIYAQQQQEVEHNQGIDANCRNDDADNFNSNRHSMADEQEAGDSEENQDEIYPIYQNIHHPNYPTAQTEFNQYVVSTSEQNDYLYEQLTRKNNLIFLNRIQPDAENGVEDGILSSQISFNETEDHVEDLNMENKNDSLRESLQKQRKFEQLELNVTHQYNYYMTSMKTLQTQQSKMDHSCLAHNCDENLSHEIQVNNMHVKKIGVLMNQIQYRTQKHTQNSSRDFGVNHSRVGSNNIFKQIRAKRQNHQATRSSIDQQQRASEMCRRVFNHGRFMSLPCNQLAAIQKIKDKKLASPVKCQIYKGDNNDDIPQQMTDEQQNSKMILDVKSTLYGTQAQMSENFMTSHYQSGTFLKPQSINFVKKTDRKTLKTYQKNLNNYHKQQNSTGDLTKKYASCNLLFKHKKLTLNQKVRQNMLLDENSINQEVLQEQSNEEENSQNSPNAQNLQDPQNLSQRSSSDGLSREDGLSLEQIDCGIQMTQKSNYGRNFVGNSNRKQQTLITLTHASQMQTKACLNGPGTTNQTTGTGFVTAIETLTQQDHNDNHLLGTIDHVDQMYEEQQSYIPCNDQGLIGKTTYREQKEAMQKNHYKLKQLRKQAANGQKGNKEQLNGQLEEYEGNQHYLKPGSDFMIQEYQYHNHIGRGQDQTEYKKQAKSVQNQKKRNSIGCFACRNSQLKSGNGKSKYIETEIGQIQLGRQNDQKTMKKRKSSWWSCFRANF